MKILVLNCGSSSIKYQLFDMKSKVVLTKGMIEKIGLSNSEFMIKRQNGEKTVIEQPIPNHQVGIDLILKALTNKDYGCISSLKEIDAVGHRVVHGGEKFNKSVLINDEVIKNITACIDLAPLHNPANLEGIAAVTALMGDVPQVAVFDTAFHQSMPAKSYLYGLPYALYKKYGIRRYGFHGTSHRYVTQKACEILGIPYNNTKIISCHLGNGSSLDAVVNGKSVDTSMGMTPVEGLLMGTRSGSVDAGVLSYVMEKEKLDTQGLVKLVNKDSGLLGISGVSSDMREVLQAAQDGNERAQLTIEIFLQKIKRYLGAYAAEIGGVDVIIFTGGIGENNSFLRDKICAGLEFMGVEFNSYVNEAVHGEEAIISSKESRVKVMVIPTDEELMIATDTMNLISK